GSVLGWPDGSASITVLDNESPILALKVPAEVSEGDGQRFGAGTVEIAAPAAANLRVDLASLDESEVLVPSFVFIPKGQTNAMFDITVVDDAVLDGTQEATLQASAPGLEQASAVIAVHDN
ncbi:MAG: hypothetical protein DME26_05265, partial [Verrucomicrobia bacterium]